MALEAVVFAQDMFLQSAKDLYSSMIGGPWGYDLGGNNGLEEGKDEVARVECGAGVGDGIGESTLLESSYWDPSCSSLVRNLEEWDVNSSPEACAAKEEALLRSGSGFGGEAAGAAEGRRKRRRSTKSCKNKEEVENQRMTHIAVERNRRKQMNEYLAVLRSLMPPSYAQRGDQASIIGGAINFVKELEQLLQSLEAQKRTKQRSETATGFTTTTATTSTPFSDFFTFPQYSTCSSTQACGPAGAGETASAVAGNRSAVADIEVTMVESHASLRVLSRRRPKQLLRMVVGLQSLRLTTLHLNVTTVEQMVLYSFSVKVEDDCRLTSVDEIATAVYQMLGRIQEGIGF